MPAKTVVVSILLSFCMAATAQQQTHQQLLDEKRTSIESIMGTFSGKPESFESLIKKGTEGLAIAKTEDYAYKFLFYQSIGTGYYYKQDFKLASENYELAYENAVAGKMIEKSLKPLGNLVSVYHYMGEQKKADDAAQKLKQFAETVDTLKNKSDIYYNLGLYNQQQKFYYSVALDNFLKSAALAKPVADTTNVTKLKTDYGLKLMMIAEVYLYLKQPGKALQYLEESRPFQNLSKVFDIAAYGKYIRTYALLNNKTEAKKYYDLLQKTAEEAPGKWSELVSSNLELASLALKEKDFTIAKLYLDKADRQSRIDNKEILTSGVNLAYGHYYRARKDYMQAINYYKLAEPGSVAYNKEQYLELLKSLTAVEILNGQQQNASANFDKLVTLSDSLTDRKIALNIAEMEAVFQNKNKEQQITTKNAELSAARIRQLWLISGIALLLLVALLLIAFYRNKKKTADLLDDKNKALAKLNADLEEANQTKAKLFGIISHDLRSPINQVYQFLKLQQLNPQLLNEQQKTELSDKIQTATGSLLETMEDLLIWSKTQMSEFKTAIQPTDLAPIVSACQNLLQLNSDAKNIRLKSLLPGTVPVKTDPYYLQTIVRNLLQNAIKAAPTGSEVELGVEETGSNTVLFIQNPGGGFTQENFQQLINNSEHSHSLHGLGLRLVDELSQKIGVGIRFHTTGNANTRVDILIPTK